MRQSIGVFLRAFGRIVRHGRLPGQLIIQLTDACNARCPQCDMRASHTFSRSIIDRQTVYQALEHAAKQGFQAVSFTGGEPFLCFELLIELIEHAGKLGIPLIRTGTNGYFLRAVASNQGRDQLRRKIERLARTPLRNLWISIDAADPETHDQMRGFSGLTRAIEKALPIFHEFGLYPTANLGINRRMGGAATWELDLAEPSKERQVLFLDTYRQAFRAFYRHVINLGFTMVSACYPMSLEPGLEQHQPREMAAESEAMNLEETQQHPSESQESDRQQDAEHSRTTGPVRLANHEDLFIPTYRAVASDRVVRFTSLEKRLLFQALLDVIPEFEQDIRIFTPRCSVYSLVKKYSGETAFLSPCYGGIDFFFLSAVDGCVYPCGYRGAEKLGRFPELDLNRSSQPFCQLCDWECFRDPSELGHPLIQWFHRPALAWRHFRQDRTFWRLWWTDMMYAWQCQFFDGRAAPNFLGRSGTGDVCPRPQESGPGQAGDREKVLAETPDCGEFPEQHGDRNSARMMVAGAYENTV